MNVIVVGCGRVGVALALSLESDHQVTVVDANADAFDHLGAHFSGRTVLGEGLDREVLLRAGIETADALAAVTASDNVNTIVARIAEGIFGLKRVVARIYDPLRGPVYDLLNIQTVASSDWGAHRIEELLTRPELQRPASAGRWVWQSSA
ncbi:MAG TPA: TrkA family potassium uptake protein [Anaerolineales bacterium]|nr:TrkA family potassium uptake protein [Anaerolineales bacterium]